MAFIINKKSKLGDKEIRLYYLVSNHREGNKIKRETLLSLNESPNLSEALRTSQTQVETILLRKNDLENRLQRVKEGDSTAFIKFCPYWKQQSRMIKLIKIEESELVKTREIEHKLIDLSSTPFFRQ